MNSQAPTIRFAQVVGGIPKYVGACITLAVASSVAYEYMYFNVIGREFLSIYSPADFLKLSLYWLPGFIVIAIFGIAINYGNAKYRMVLYQHDVELADRTFKIPDRMVDISTAIIFVMSIISIPNMKLENIGILLVPGFIILGLLFRKTLAQTIMTRTDKPIEALFLFLFLVMLFVSSFTSGLGNAITDLKKAGPLYDIKSSAIDARVVVVRNLDKGIVFREDGKKTISFVPWDDVKLLKSAEVYVPEKTLYQYVRSWFSS